MSFILDTYGMPSDAELKMSGCIGASRYVSHSSGKNVTSSQIKHIHSLNKLVQLNFEDTATNAKGGFSQGKADAAFVLSEFRSLGVPKGVACYFSVDYEVHTGQSAMAVIVDYFRPIQTALHAAGYLVGAYGDADVLTALFNAKVIDFGWQTVAWSYGHRNTDAVELQDTFTNAYDKDEILKTYIGAWAPTGAQINPKEEEFTVAQYDNIIAELNAIRAQLTAVEKTVVNVVNGQTSKIVHGSPDLKNSLDSIGKQVGVPQV